MRFLYWQVSQAMYKHDVAFNFVNNTKLIASKGRTSSTANYYNGLADFAEMSFILHTLKKGDLFGDIGANVGVFSVLASSTGANSLAVEPIPHTFEVMKKNIALNNYENRILSQRLGVGDKVTTLKFLNNFDVINGVCKFQDQVENTIDVEVSTLDIIFKDRVPDILKIDVEGYEWNVLQGGANVLSNKQLKAIIIETNVNEEQVDSVHQKLIEHGFAIYEYDPYSRTLSQASNYIKVNAIYIRDYDWAKKCVAEADPYQVWGIKI